ncbi:MAG TPA: KUP/HAK/KT family potassium transporter, partial [Rhodanobacteraceae bacterium]
MDPQTSTQQHPVVGADDRNQTAIRGLVVGAIGVVFGDIGTSPLYTMKEAFYGPHGMPVGTLNILGILSLV